MRAALGLVLVVACGGKAAPGHAAEPSCRDLAVRGEALIAAAPAGEREAALRFVVEVIDLCQAPGLAVRARTCLVGAPSLAAARDCPSLPSTGGDVGDPNRAEAPSCDDVVARAVELAEDMLPDQRADEEARFRRDCDDVTPEGRRCAHAAASLDDLEDCFSENLIEDEQDDDTRIKDPFAP